MASPSAKSLATVGLLVAAVIALLKGAWAASALITLISAYVAHSDRAKAWWRRRK